MVEHMLWTVHESLVQGYCATADCVTGDCARLCDKRYYCTLEKEKNTTSYARNTGQILVKSRLTHELTQILKNDLQMI